LGLDESIFTDRKAVDYFGLKSFDWIFGAQNPVVQVTALIRPAYKLNFLKKPYQVLFD
jgi:hypothetical protein